MANPIVPAGFLPDVDEIAAKCAEILEAQLRQPIKTLTIVVAVGVALGVGYVVFLK